MIRQEYDGEPAAVYRLELRLWLSIVAMTHDELKRKGVLRS